MFGKKTRRIRELETKLDYLQEENTRLKELCNEQHNRVAEIEPLLSSYIAKEKAAYLKRSEAAMKAAVTCKQNKNKNK